MLQVSTSNIMKVALLQWVFFTFLKLYKWDKIVQSVSFDQEISLPSPPFRNAI